MAFLQTTKLEPLTRFNINSFVVLELVGQGH